MVRGIPRIIWWITGLHVALLVAYSILLPTFRAPDEPHHVDLARLFSEDLRYPAWDERDIATSIQHALDEARFFEGSVDLTEDDAPPKDERPSFDNLEALPGPTSVNQLSQHPPLYYVVAGGSERLAEVVVDEPSFDLETWFYRLVSVLCVAPLPLIIWTTARRLGAPAAVGIAAALVPLAIPQLTHIGSAVNNDNLMFLLFWLLTPLALRLADGDLRPRIGLLAGVITGLALFTKGFALVLPVWVLAALLVALWRGGRERLRDVTLTGALYGLSALALGGWWWVRNLVVYQSLSPSRYSTLVPDADHVDVELGTFLQSWSYRTTRRFWGDFGWFDVHLPTLAFGLATAVCLLGIAVACTRPDRVGGSARGNRLLLASPLLLLVAAQFAFAFRGYLHTGQLPGMQGRYWFGAIAGAAVVIALGLANLRPAWTQRLPLAVLAGAAVMQAVAVYAILRHYWGPGGTPFADRLRAVVAWAPIPGEVIGVGTTVGVVVAVATAGQLVRLAVAGSADSEDRSPAAASSVAAAPPGATAETEAEPGSTSDTHTPAEQPTLSR